MQNKTNLTVDKGSGKTLTSYIVGFALSLVFTLVAYFAVVGQLFVGQLLVVFVVTLAFAQFTVQLFLFLHLGYESGPRWRLIIFLVTFSLLLVIVLGSVWIMNHLNYSMMQMTPQQIDAYMINHI